ncbi:MAG: right-handed parallel beta-helix repeat-containing protein [Chitinispirillaceae bacterium]|nr:right-handed parallel beta-helix repeat-containing protein [Chitinispirillaceae bacterium]
MHKVVEQIYKNLFVFISLSGTIFSTSYYVSTEGNDSYAGTRDNPFKSIPVAIGKAVAGDTISITSGTYSFSTPVKIGKNGTSEKRIHLIGSKDSRPVLNFSSMSLAGGNQGIILNGDYWHIKGLIIKGAGDNGLLIQGGSNNTIEFCDFLDNRDSGCQLKGGASNNRIINCDSYNNRDPDEGDADGFAPKMDVGSGNRFIGCRPGTIPMMDGMAICVAQMMSAQHLKTAGVFTMDSARMEVQAPVMETGLKWEAVMIRS